MEAKVSKAKKAVVKEFADLFKQYPIVAAVNMENLPAKQLQSMRAQLREKVVMKMTKRTLMKFAIEEAKKSKKGIEKLEEHLKGMPALMFTKENPFSLYKTIQKNKSNAPAKAGQIAPEDIIVKAGPTSFAPGPVIGELGAIGIKTTVEGGKIAIKQDSIVVKEGQVIKPNVAAMLARLGIEPMKIGLEITAIFENGSIFKKDVLAVDEEAYIKNIGQCASWAFNLAIEAGIFNLETTEFMVQKAFRESKAVAMEANFPADAVVGEMVEKAEREMLALKSQLKI